MKIKKTPERAFFVVYFFFDLAGTLFLGALAGSSIMVMHFFRSRVEGSVPFGILKFFFLNEIYGPKRPFSTFSSSPSCSYVAMVLFTSACFLALIISIARSMPIVAGLSSLVKP